MKWMEKNVLEASGVKEPQKIEAAIIDILAREHLTIAAARDILDSAKSTIMCRTVVTTHRSHDENVGN